MSSPHLGVVVGKTARLDEILFAPTGELFSSADAVSFGYRELGLLTLEPKVISDFAKQEKQYAWLAKIQHTSFQATFAALRAAYLLSKGFVIARVREDVTQDKYYFINDPTPDSPTGSTNLGLKFTYKHTVEKAILDIMAQGQLSQAQYDYLLGQVAATITGETGGATAGIPAGVTGYNEANFVPGNIRKMQITNSDGTALEGSILNFDFELTSMGEDDHDDQDRYTHNKYKYTLTGRSKSADPLNQKAWNLDTKGLTTIVVTDAIGRTITVNQARANATVTIGDNKRDIGFKYTGEVSQNRSESSPNCLDLGKIAVGNISLSTTGLN